jgi:hypothetical protein
MNAGLGSLAMLKAQLLADALRAGTRYDAQLLTIGRGVAAAMEGFCDRKLARVEDDTFVCTADRIQVYLERYPIESIASVHLKTDTVSGWVAQTSLVMNTNDDSGLVYWGSAIAPDYCQLKFTYTGGFWFDETEEGTDIMPAGATALPDDLQLAWVLQCRATWAAIDKLGKDIVNTGSSATKTVDPLVSIELLPQVVDILNGYCRYQIV